MTFPLIVLVGAIVFALVGWWKSNVWAWLLAGVLLLTSIAMIVLYVRTPKVDAATTLKNLCATQAYAIGDQTFVIVDGKPIACDEKAIALTPSTPAPSAPGSVEIAPVLPTAGPNVPVETAAAADGHTYFNACTSVDLDPKITQLKSKGQVVPNSFMFLDKDEIQVPAGDYWFIDVPPNVYGHIYYPFSGLTYQVRGPAKLMVGAATFWCDNGGSTPHDGMYQMVDDERLDKMLLDSFWELTGDGAIGAWVNVPSIENQPK